MSFSASPARIDGAFSHAYFLNLISEPCSNFFAILAHRRGVDVASGGIDVVPVGFLSASAHLYSNGSIRHGAENCSVPRREKYVSC